MKQLFLVVALVTASGNAMDSASAELERTEPLLTARMRWMGNEDLFCYAKLTMSIPGCDDYSITSRANNELLALVDMNKKLITTYLTVPADESKITLHSFEHFKNFLQDPELKAEIKKCQTMKKNLSILCSVQ